jgi:hypothetical protein
MIVYILGEAHSGKSQAAKYLKSKYRFVEIGLADPLKRALMDWYDFTLEQLWGDSSERNRPDDRYPRVVASFDDGDAFEACRFGIKDPGKVDFLTPREACQKLGEAMRSCYSETWVRILLRDINRLRTPIVYPYEKDDGHRYPAYFPHKGVSGLIYTTHTRKFLVSDVRYRNEHEALRKEGAKGFRIRSPYQGKGLEGKLAAHRSETEQRTIPDSELDAVIENDGTLDQLREKIDKFVSEYCNCN